MNCVKYSERLPAMIASLPGASLDGFYSGAGCSNRIPSLGGSARSSASPDCAVWRIHRMWSFIELQLRTSLRSRTSSMGGEIWMRSWMQAQMKRIDS